MNVSFRKIAITPDYIWENENVEIALYKWLELAVNKYGADAIYFRNTQLEKKQLYNFIALINGIPFRRSFKSLITYYPSFDLKVDGYHMKSNQEIPSIKNKKMYYGKSCHSLKDALEAQAAGYHYVFLSPIFLTTSHPHQKPLGLDYLKAVCEKISLPVFALGGLKKEHEMLIKSFGAHGIAGIRLYSSI